MAANNYYGFTHGGTQYGNQYTPSNQGYTTGQPYPPPQGAQVSQAQAYAAPSADAYVISGYTRPAQPGAAAAQSYYPQQQTQQNAYATATTPGKVAPPTRPAAPSTAYPSYTANTAGVAGTTSYAGFTQTPQQQPPSTNKAATFTNYDAAVYNAVTAYAQGTTSKGSGFGFKRHGGGGPHMNKMKGSRPMQSKPQTLHYCDVCKISCAGPQTYKEHLEGQKHKKKEAAQKGGAGTAPATKGVPGGLRCELCDVTCTGTDAYAAHIRGAKHQKVLKLHTKLGKPIPSDNPTVVPAATNGQQQQSTSGTTTTPSKPVQKPATTSSVFGKQGANVGPPKVSFIGPKTDYDRYGQNPQQQQSDTTQQQNTTVQQTQPNNSSQPATSNNNVSVTGNTASGASVSEGKSEAAVYVEKDIQPVGQDYIEEVRSDDGKVVSFNCKLCECRFNDPNAKEMHMKGRRHRLQYKKKVNPDLIVDVKPSSRQKKIDEKRAQRTPQSRKNQSMNDVFPRGPIPLLPPGPGPRGFPPGYGPMGGPHMPPFLPPPIIRRLESMEDRHVMARHGDIYPQEEELQAIQKIVSNTEKALKFVSDQFAETDVTKVQNGAKDEDSIGETGVSHKPEPDLLQASRVLKGVMRVGHLAKGLLLRGDRAVQLVVLCSEKPTITMLDRIVDALPHHLQSVAPDDKYQLIKKISEAALVVSSEQEPKIEVTVTLTSPLMRNPVGNGTENSNGAAAGEAQATQVKDEPDVLDKEKCLDALAELRHAKWFQARATALQSCVIVIRILRDLCQRVAAWHALPCWAVELLSEKTISSTGVLLGPGEALRVVLEVVSSGVLLQNGRGLLDPCEKEPVDALGGLSNQSREDITFYAQQALRQVAFRQIHKVLGMEPLPRFQKKPINNRKRRRDNNEPGEGDERDEMKKEKKEEGMNNSISADVKEEPTT